jgi:hypothetical protein
MFKIQGQGRRNFAHAVDALNLEGLKKPYARGRRIKAQRGRDGN